jgi:hypothetical protein
VLHWGQISHGRYVIRKYTESLKGDKLIISTLETHTNQNICDSNNKTLGRLNVNLTLRSEISGSHGGEYEEGSLLGCCAV